MGQYDELVEKAIKEYGMKTEAAVRYAKATIATKKFVASKKFQVAQKLAKKTGLTVAEILHRGLDKEFPDGNIPEDAAKAIITPVLHHNYTVVSEVAETVQKDILEEAGIGIKPVIPPFNKDRADGIAKAVANGASAAEFEKIVVNHSQNIVDESIKENAKVHQQMGLEPRVTRIYDGVGVHKRKDPCAWCKARAGTDMPYNEAYAKGSFERHPGCGCEILYKVGKRIQRQSDWTRNEWEDVSPYERIAELASQEGEMVTIPSFMEGNFEDCHPLSITDEEREVFKRIHEEVAKRGCEYGEIITSDAIIPCESNKESSVLMRTDNIDEYGLKLYHGHTNDTPPSEKDLFRFVSDEKVNKIGVVTRNGDIFTVTVGDGYIPSEGEFHLIVADAASYARRYVVDHYNLSGLSEKEIEYLVIRTKNIEIIQQLGWRIEGGKV